MTGKVGYGDGEREPSAGVVTRAVHGAGKLNAGVHDLTVLSVPVYPNHAVLLLENPAGHVHSECVALPVPGWVRAGARVRGVIAVGPGFVCVRDVTRYQLRDAITRRPCTEWSEDLGQLYAQALQQGVAPATTQLVELSNVGSQEHWRPVIHQGPSSQNKPS
jgi:hypothetical protein